MKLTGAEQIEIKIDDTTGEVEIETHGFTGRKCTDATKQIEKMLGASHDRKKKKEYFQQEQATNQRRLTQG